MKRACGMLLPISSLPSKYGIGTFSKEAYEFVDKLKAAGQRYWQILPLGPTGYGDSPYQAFSAFAGNPYFIDLEELIEMGVLIREECDWEDFGNEERYVNYEKMYFHRFPLLKRAFIRWKEKQRAEGKTEDAISQWLAEVLSVETQEYCFYMAIKNAFGGKCWTEWDEDIRMREEKAVAHYRRDLREEIEFYEFQQWMFEKQWKRLKAYANEKGIQIIGDIPIYVAFDGSDSWSHPELFQFDEACQPIAVAGCPPDAFSATGQLWGNPLYRWDYHKETGYEWWMKRMEYSFSLYDVVRVDHFRGFDEYYAIPAQDTTAQNGTWEAGPGIDLFHKMKERFGTLNIIAEDLGYLTPTVLELVKETGFPGMKVLEFAFDSGSDCAYLPHRYDENCVVYTGTHDNMTLQGWYRTLNDNSKSFALRYLGNGRTPQEEIHWDYIRLAMQSVAQLAVIPLQDYLGYDEWARMNTPSTLGMNWRWRMTREDFSDELIWKCREIAYLYGRLSE